MTSPVCAWFGKATCDSQGAPGASDSSPLPDSRSRSNRSSAPTRLNLSRSCRRPTVAFSAFLLRPQPVQRYVASCTGHFPSTAMSASLQLLPYRVLVDSDGSWTMPPEDLVLRSLMYTSVLFMSKVTLNISANGKLHAAIHADLQTWPLRLIARHQPPPVSSLLTRRSLDVSRRLRPRRSP